MNPVTHFEMPYEDRQRLVKFYTDVFGWRMQHMGEEMGDYVTASTTEADEAGRPKNPGAINGGFFPRKPDGPPPCPSLVIAVDDIQAAIQKVKDGGGEVLGEPVHIPGVGRYASFSDTEGNRASILQPDQM